MIELNALWEMKECMVGDSGIDFAEFGEAT